MSRDGWRSEDLLVTKLQTTGAWVIQAEPWRGSGISGEAEEWPSSDGAREERRAADIAATATSKAEGTALRRSGRRNTPARPRRREPASAAEKKLCTGLASASRRLLLLRERVRPQRIRYVCSATRTARMTQWPADCFLVPTMRNLSMPDEWHACTTLGLWPRAYLNIMLHHDRPLHAPCFEVVDWIKG